jgi:hypothetical protein
MPTHHTKSRKSRKSLTKRKSRISKKTKLSKETKLSKRSKANKKGGGNPPNPNFSITDIKKFVMDAINTVEPDSGLIDIKKTVGNGIIYFIFNNKENAEKFSETVKKNAYPSSSDIPWDFNRYFHSISTLYATRKNYFDKFIKIFIPGNEYGRRKPQPIYNALTYGSNIEVLGNSEFDSMLNEQIQDNAQKRSHLQNMENQRQAAMGQPPADMPDVAQSINCPEQECKKFMPTLQKPDECGYCGCPRENHSKSPKEKENHLKRLQKDMKNLTNRARQEKNKQKQ